MCERVAEQGGSARRTRRSYNEYTFRVCPVHTSFTFPPLHLVALKRLVYSSPLKPTTRSLISPFSPPGPELPDSLSFCPWSDPRFVCIFCGSWRPPTFSPLPSLLFLLTVELIPIRWARRRCTCTLKDRPPAVQFDDLIKAIREQWPTVLLSTWKLMFFSFSIYSNLFNESKKIINIIIESCYIHYIWYMYYNFRDI